MLKTLFDPRRWSHIPDRLRARLALRTLNPSTTFREVNGMVFNVLDEYAERFPPQFDPEVVEFYREQMSPEQTCLNIGANLGVLALIFARWLPRGRVFAFEPAPFTARVLRAHVALNHCRSRVRVVEQAVSDRSGAADFYAEAESVMNRLGAPNSNLQSVRKITVPVTTVDDYCRQHGLRPDWIHIDVEGFEPCVLRGARQTLAANSDLKFVVDMHPGEWHLTKTDRRGFERLIDDLGLAATCLIGADGPFGWGTTLFERR